MKATLEFNLPEESAEHNMAVNAQKLASAIFEADEMLRKWQKYGIESGSESQKIMEIRSVLCEVMGIAEG